MHFPSKPPLAN